MPITVPQEKSVGGTTATTLTLTIAATAAGSILVVGANASLSGITISDQHSDTYTDCGLGVVNGNVAFARMGAFLNLTTGTTTVTLTITGGTPSFSELIAWEVAGLSSAAFDKKVENGSSTPVTAMTSGSTGTLSSASEIGIGYMISGQGASAGSQGTGWSADEGANNGITANQNFAQHIVTSSTAAITATANQVTTSVYDAFCVTLLSQVVAAKGGTLPLMGVG